MEIGLIILTVSVAIVLIRLINKTDNETEINEIAENRRKSQLKEMIEKREERSLFEEYDEGLFWDIISKAHERNSESYKSQLNIFKDLIMRFDPEDLVKIDNLINRLIKDNINQNLVAASTIIFKRGELSFTILLMNILMARGKVFFVNACCNPNLIIGKKIENIDGRLYFDLIEELYSMKTNKLIPSLPKDRELNEIPGDPWLEKELPSRFPELWAQFS